MYSKKQILVIFIEIVAAVAVVAFLVWLLATTIHEVYGYEKPDSAPTPTETLICTPVIPTTALEAALSPTAGASATPSPMPTPTPTVTPIPTPTPLVCTGDTFPSCTVNWEMDRMDCVCKFQEDAIIPAGVPNTGRAEN